MRETHICPMVTCAFDRVVGSTELRSKEDLPRAIVGIQVETRAWKFPDRLHSMGRVRVEETLGLVPGGLI